MNIQKILIVEDSILSTNLIIHSIPQAEKYQITTATDGQRAWSELMKSHPDLIILDINMPNVTGWTFLEHLRFQKLSIPVAICTTEIVNEQKLRDYQIFAYIRKPIHKNQFMTLFQKLTSA